MYSQVFALGILEDFDFIIRIVIFSYLLYWLYMTFNELPILFGISVIIGGSFMLFYAIPTIILVILFFPLLFVPFYFGLYVDLKMFSFSKKSLGSAPRKL